MNVLKIAWRNVRRNRRRTIVTVAAMTFALWVEVLYSGLIVGFMHGMERDVLDLEVGDLQIFAGDYLDKPSLYTFIEAPAPLLDRLDEAGYRASARLQAGALAAAGDYSAGVALRGLDVVRDAAVSLVGTKIAEGTWLDPSDIYGVVVGRRLARTLDVGTGDELIVLTQGADGSIANELYTVRGVLLGVADGTDRSAVFMNEAAFRELMVFPSGTHQIVVRRPAEVELEAAAAEVRGLAPELTVKTWAELMPVIATMLESTEAMIMIIFFIVYVAVAILILNAMLMAVFERIKEFGVLKALGVGPLRVVSLILVECAMQAAIAIVLGLTLAVPGMWYLTKKGIDVGVLAGTDMMGVAIRPVWYGIYDAGTVSIPVVMLVVIVFFAALYPALKAAWIQPVAAMRHR